MMKKLLLILCLLQAGIMQASETPTYRYRNTIRFWGDKPSPCSQETKTFYEQATGKKFAENELCWFTHVVRGIISDDKDEPVFSVNQTDRQYTNDMTQGFKTEVFPHGLPSGDKFFHEKLRNAKTSAEKQKIREEYQAAYYTYYNQYQDFEAKKNSDVESLPKVLDDALDYIPDSLIADKKEGDTIDFAVNGKIFTLVCAQQFFRLGLREEGIVRNITFHDLRDFLLKRYRGEITMTDDEIRTRGGWPIKTTGYEPYLLGWRRFFISEKTYAKYHAEHCKQRWED